jgi:hypothetical protein
VHQEAVVAQSPHTNSIHITSNWPISDPNVVRAADRRMNLSVGNRCWQVVCRCVSHPPGACMLVPASVLQSTNGGLTQAS